MSVALVSLFLKRIVLVLITFIAFGTIDVCWAVLRFNELSSPLPLVVLRVGSVSVGLVRRAARGREPMIMLLLLLLLLLLRLAAVV